MYLIYYLHVFICIFEFSIKRIQYIAVVAYVHSILQHNVKFFERGLV